MLRRGVLFLALALVAAPMALHARAATGTSPDNFIANLGAEVIGVISDARLTVEQREREFHRILLENVDVDRISRTVLGRYWRSATDEQRREFQTLYREYIIKIYANRFGRYNGEAFRVKGMRPETDGEALVFSAIEPQQGPPYQVNWRVRHADGAFKVTDVMAEGVSLLITHNQEFAAVIQNGGGRVDALLEALRKRTAEAAAR